MWKPGLTQKYFSIVTKLWNSTLPEVTKSNSLANSQGGTRHLQRHWDYWVFIILNAMYSDLGQYINCCKLQQEPAWKAIGRLLHLVLRHLAQILQEKEQNLVLKLNEYEKGIKTLLVYFFTLTHRFTYCPCHISSVL